MPVVVYMDESGDHTLEIIDKDFPIFCLTLFICEEETYIRKIIPQVVQYKFRWFGHEGTILHSRDIRKALPPYRFLKDRIKREAFTAGLSNLMQEMDYTLISIAICKQAHRDRYRMAAQNPYDLAVKFALERLLPLLENKNQNQVTIIAEARGRREDKELHTSFLKVVHYGTEYIPATRFRGVQFSLDFVKKERNVIGTQIADVAGYPTARYALDRTRPNPAFNLLRHKFYTGPGQVRGLKIFP